MSLKDKFIVSAKSELKPLGLNEKYLKDVVDTFIDIISTAFVDDGDIFSDKIVLEKTLKSNCSMMEDVILSTCGFEVYEKYKKDVDDTFVENVINKLGSV